MTNNNKTTYAPCVYVACLAAYNDGVLHGCWIDAAQDESAIFAEVEAMLEASPIEDAEEWAIHDYDDFGGLVLSEWEGFAAVSEKALFLVEHGEPGALALQHYDDVATAREALEEHYQGEFESLADYAHHLTEETGVMGEIPEYVRYYIDYEAMARDMDYSGDVICLEDAAGRLHIFTNH